MPHIYSVSKLNSFLIDFINKQVYLNKLKRDQTFVNSGRSAQVLLVHILSHVETSLGQNGREPVIMKNKFVISLVVNMVLFFGNKKKSTKV